MVASELVSAGGALGVGGTAGRALGVGGTSDVLGVGGTVGGALGVGGTSDALVDDGTSGVSGVGGTVAGASIPVPVPSPPASMRRSEPGVLHDSVPAVTSTLLRYTSSVGSVIVLRNLTCTISSSATGRFIETESSSGVQVTV